MLQKKKEQDLADIANNKDQLKAMQQDIKRQKDDFNAIKDEQATLLEFNFARFEVEKKKIEQQWEDLKLREKELKSQETKNKKV